MSHHELDARRLLCPMPVIRTQAKVAQLAAGDTLEVVCTDPGALHDIPAWARMFGHQVIDTRSNPDDVRVTLRIAGAPKTP